MVDDARNNNIAMIAALSNFSQLFDRMRLASSNETPSLIGNCGNSRALNILVVRVYRSCYVTEDTGDMRRQVGWSHLIFAKMR